MVLTSSSVNTVALLDARFGTQQRIGDACFDDETCVESPQQKEECLQVKSPVAKQHDEKAPIFERGSSSGL